MPPGQVRCRAEVFADLVAAPALKRDLRLSTTGLNRKTAGRAAFQCRPVSSSAIESPRVRGVFAE